MTRRVASESKQPGMRAIRRCGGCGALLALDEDRCPDCSPPELSARARAAGELRRRENAEVAQAGRRLKGLESLIRRLHRRLKNE